MKLAADTALNEGDSTADFPAVKHHSLMPRTLYSPRLSDDVVRSLYREGQRRGLPMTRLADLLLREALAADTALTVLPDLRPAGPPGRAVA